MDLNLFAKNLKEVFVVSSEDYECVIVMGVVVPCLDKPTCTFVNFLFGNEKVEKRRGKVSLESDRRGERINKHERRRSCQ